MRKKRKEFAVTSLVLGILGVILFWTAIIGVTLNILAIIFGIIAMVRAKNEPKIYAGKEIGIIGIILGIAGLILMTLTILFLLSVYKTIGINPNPTALTIFDLLPKGG